MDGVLEEMRGNKSFKQGSRLTKQAEAQGTAIVASSHSPPTTEPVPERDGGPTASTSDSDDT